MPTKVALRLHYISPLNLLTKILFLPFSQNLTGNINCFANNNAISSFLPDDLARFFRAYPAIRVTLEERLSKDIVAAVASRRADVGIVAMETQHPDLKFIPYRDDELVLLAAKNTPTAAKQRITFSECLNHPFISLQHGAALHTYLLNQATALGKRLDIRVQVSGYRAIARLVASGAGLGIVPRSSMLSGDIEDVAVVNLRETWAKRNLCVCIREERSESSPHVDKFIQVLCGV